jgi:hypothetical protein
MIDASIAGASNEGNYVWISIPLTLPSTLDTKTFVAAAAKISIIEHKSLSDIQIQVKDNTGAELFGNKNYTTFVEDDIASGKTITIQTCASVVDLGATSLTMYIYIVPKTVSSPSGFVFKGVLKEAGMFFVQNGETV